MAPASSIASRLRFEAREVAPGVTLLVGRTRRFTTFRLQLTWVAPLDRTAGATALLAQVLTHSTARYPTFASWSAALEECWGATCSADVGKLGEYHLMALDFEAPAPARVPDGAAQLDRCLDFVTQVLHEPRLTGAPRARAGPGFTRDAVASERRQLLRRLRGVQNDKRLYAYRRCLETLCARRAYRRDEHGDEATVARLDGARLARHFDRKMTGDRLLLHAVGDLPVARLEDWARALVAPWRRRVRALAPVAPYRARRRPRSVVERVPAQQAQLVLGLGIDAPPPGGRWTAAAAERRTLLVWNAVFGELASSKLFRVVRERHGLCYAIQSWLELPMNVGFVHAGIDPGARAAALTVIEEQLDEMRRGVVSATELRHAHRALEDRYRAAEDQPGALIGLDLQQRLGLLPGCEERGNHRKSGNSELSTRNSELPSDWRRCFRGFGAVTAADLAAVSQRISVDVVYFLAARKGGGGGRSAEC